MKKRYYRRPEHVYSLGDLIQAVSESSLSSRETVAAVADLLESGRVRFMNNGRPCRAKVC